MGRNSLPNTGYSWIQTVRSCYKFAYNRILGIPSLYPYIDPLQSKNGNIFNAESRVLQISRESWLFNRDQAPLPSLKNAGGLKFTDRSHFFSRVYPILVRASILIEEATKESDSGMIEFKIHDFEIVMCCPMDSQVRLKSTTIDQIKRQS